MLTGTKKSTCLANYPDKWFGCRTSGLGACRTSGLGAGQVVWMQDKWFGCRTSGLDAGQVVWVQFMSLNIM